MSSIITIVSIAALMGAAYHFGGAWAALPVAVAGGCWFGFRDLLGTSRRLAGDLALLAAAVFVVSIAIISPAVAQVQAVPVATAVPADPLRTIVELVVGAAVTAFLTWLYRRLGEWFGLQVDAKHRDALHSALTTAANLMLSQVAASGQAKLISGVNQVWAGAREAIDHFGLDDQKIEKMLQAKVQAADVAGLAEPTPQSSAIVARRSPEKA